MNTGLIILIVVIVVAGAAAAGYFLMQPADNASSNNTTANNTTTVSNTTTTNTSSDNQQNQSTQTKSLISAAQAQAIANNYLNSNSKYVNFDAGTPSLRGTVYYVPMVVNNDDSQSPKGTVVGNVKVDGTTGAVLGIQSWDIETNEEISEPP